MADPTSRSHGRGAPKMPVPPNAGGRTPVSFQPNVNRAKTKRWVEAKQYSYDGTDWGDEEDEYQEEEPPPVPRPPYTQQRTGSASDLSSKRLSGLAFGADGSQGSSAAEDQKALPFIRPADIYKRMREQQGTPPAASDSGSQNDNSQSSVQPETAPAQASDSQTSQGLIVPSQTQAVPSIGLPELKRVSGFGTDFMNSGFQKTNTEPTEPSLQHQQSQGFRSVVHQAFDVPETPSSTTGSVGRSNSDGTSVVSPIMGARSMNDDKTPTILEEPEVVSPAAVASPEPVNEGPVFRPGHRRDMSLPSRDNSPARRTMITELDAPSAGQVEMSSPEIPSQASTPKQPLDAESYLKRASMQRPSSTTENDFIAPLKLGNSRPTSYDTRHGSIPIILPEGADNSPRDVDNDRLSKDIIRSLSRESSPFDGAEQEAQQNQPQAPDDSIPHQYEKYWDDGQTGPNDEQPTPLVSETHPDWTGPHPLAPQDPYSSSQAAGGDAPSEQPKKPKLERKFSWESSSSGDQAEPQVPGSYFSPPLGASLTVQEPEPLSYDAVPGTEEPDAAQMAAAGMDADSERSVERPMLSIVPPMVDSSSPPEQLLKSEVLPDPVGEMGEATMPPATSNLINEASLLGFRDILGIKSADERIRAFDRTRDQFAALDTGLQHWVEFIVHDHPEYADLQNQGPSTGADRASPTQSRFPKLTSFGTLASTLNTNSPTSATHNRRPSAHLGTIRNRPNVELRGKELLQTAGAFSGKAGEAAKGLFAKGRNKFRPSDKVQTPTATRKSLQFPFSPGANGSNANFSFRSSVTLGNLFKSSRNEESISNYTKEPITSPNGTNPGLRVKSMDLSRLQSDTANGGSAQKRARLSLDQTQRASKATSGSDYAGALEREMVAALGLSPTDPGLTSWERSVPFAQGTQAQVEEDTADLTEKNLRAVPEQQFDQKRSEIAPSSIRPLSDEIGPVPPPKDVPLPPPKDNPNTLPKVYPFMRKSNNATARQSSDSSEAEDKPSLPPKDQPPPPSKHQPIPPPKDYMTVPQPMDKASSHASISSIGTEDQGANRPPESSEFYNSPPSPLQKTADQSNGEPALQASVSRTSLPSAEEVAPDYKPVYPPAPPSTSSEILETKRQSISGAPVTAPGVQSPLRNEVRYSPGTRSSMLSFGRQSGTSKETRPATPAKDISQAAGANSPGLNENSAFDKLKKFGKRRRASVGDIFSGLQGGQKRTFSRISGLFGRQNEAQLQANGATEPAKTNSNPTEFKVLSRRPLANGNAPHTSSGANSERPVPSVPKTLPSDPAMEQALPSLPADTEYLRQPRQRASMPPISSLNPLASERFYPHVTGSTPNETSDAPWRTRAENQPFPSQQYERTSTPPLGSEDSSTMQTQQQPTRLNEGSSSDPYSTAGHPHRDDEPRIVNDPPREPVELALTKDDSSDEILMSPTTYPGQEWIPTHM